MVERDRLERDRRPGQAFIGVSNNRLRPAGIRKVGRESRKTQLGTLRPAGKKFAGFSQSRLGLRARRMHGLLCRACLRRLVSKSYTRPAAPLARRRLPVEGD